ncbi:hypothetical protein HHO41_00670 [Bacillus sp. DNRA2]|uniref:hypothetical protein n=1 Tax=Bacillus sp. DNRA2 TaxID=2723053 RepID=UPI00145E1718|nr:hypothetical protein [Bacillus sp. DNRA2]NMD68780.1 hypothetical protein [Bacillus sp. DNRA2]
MVELLDMMDKISNCESFPPIFISEHFKGSRALELCNFHASSSPHYRGGGQSPITLKRERTGGLSPNALTWFSGS